jgi:hypothetical protein
MRNDASACMVTRSTRPSNTKSFTYTGASMSWAAEYTSDTFRPMDSACVRSTLMLSCGAGGSSFGCRPLRLGLF